MRSRPARTSRCTMVHRFILWAPLYVEPQPHRSPMYLIFECPIRMSPGGGRRRLLHIGFGKRSRIQAHPPSLVLDDYVRFERGFGRILDQAWARDEDRIGLIPAFAILSVSYKVCVMVLQGTINRRMLFRPERPLVLVPVITFEEGARRCRAPSYLLRSDRPLGINHQFPKAGPCGPLPAL